MIVSVYSRFIRLLFFTMKNYQTISLVLSGEHAPACKSYGITKIPSTSYLSKSHWKFYPLAEVWKKTTPFIIMGDLLNPSVLFFRNSWGRSRRTLTGANDIERRQPLRRLHAWWLYQFQTVARQWPNKCKIRWSAQVITVHGNEIFALHGRGKT